MRTDDRTVPPLAAAAARGAVGVRCCEWAGCTREGQHRAPRSRSELRLYRWFCLEHVREYNAAWNYYAGMTDDQVEADIRADTVWQRPSWRLGVAMAARCWRSQHIHDGFEAYAERHTPPPRRTEPASAEQRALLVLDLQAPVTIAIVKARYKQLVKQHHPDANGGDKAAEERFKQISEAYRTVMSSLAP